MQYLKTVSRYHRVIPQQLRWLGLTVLALAITVFSGFFIPTQALNIGDVPNPRASGVWAEMLKCTFLVFNIILTALWVS